MEEFMTLYARRCLCYNPPELPRVESGSSSTVPPALICQAPPVSLGKPEHREFPDCDPRPEGRVEVLQKWEGSLTTHKRFHGGPTALHSLLRAVLLLWGTWNWYTYHTARSRDPALWEEASKWEGRTGWPGWGLLWYGEQMERERGIQAQTHF